MEGSTHHLRNLVLPHSFGVSGLVVVRWAVVRWVLARSVVESCTEQLAVLRTTRPAPFAVVEALVVAAVEGAFLP